jgi:hypothetical protein
MNKETATAVALSLLAVFALNHFFGNILVSKKADGTLA